MKQPPTWALVLGFAVIYTSWGTTFLPIRIGVHDEGIPPALFGGVRIFCAGVILLLFQAWRRARILPARQDLPRILIVGSLLFVAGSGLMNAANQTVPSGICAVLTATTPLWLGLFAMFWPHDERLTPRGWLGLLVGLGGVLLLLSPQLADPSEFVTSPGTLLVLGSAASWAVGSLVSRHAKLTTPHLTSAALQMIAGGAGLTLLGIVIGEVDRLPERLTPAAVGAFLYLLVVGSLVGFVAFNWLLGHVAAAKVGTYAYVNPLVALLVAWAAGEHVTAWLGGGMAIILFGVFLVRGGERPGDATTSIDRVEDSNRVEDSGQRTEDRGQKSEVGEGSDHLSPDLRPLTSDL